jgi:hypothetical protein
MKNLSLFDIDDPNLDQKLLDALYNRLKDQIPDKLVNSVNAVIDNTYKFWVMSAIGESPFGERYAKLVDRRYLKNVNDTGSIFIENEADLFYNLVENGSKSWSIKDALLKGKVAKRNLAEHGTLFVSVPMRARTPVKRGDGKVHSSFTNELPQDIYRALKTGQNLSSQQKVVAGNLNLANVKAIPTVFKDNNYINFVTVSEKSKGWKHPGFNKTPIFKKVEEHLKDSMKILLDTFVEAYAEILKREIK